MDLENSPTRPQPSSGISSSALARAVGRLDAWVRDDRVPGAAAVVMRRGERAVRHFAGVADFGSPSSAPVTERTVFPAASIARPVTATILMRLVEAGEVVLDDPVSRFVPEFGRLGKDSITIRHLLTQTSGLPDRLPNEESLRKRREGLPAFVRAACRLEPAFVPSTRISYSGVGVLMLGEVVERVHGRPFADVAEQTVFHPLGLTSISFRPSPDRYADIARLRLPEGRKPTTWDINSAYWRQLGAPWGGLYATADDLARFGLCFLDSLVAREPDGKSPGAERLLSPAGARAMTTSRTDGLLTLSGEAEAWGLGWALPVRSSTSWVGDLASPSTFGHIGASGALWIDPEAELVCAVLSSQTTDWTADYRRFAAFANALQAALAT